MRDSFNLGWKLAGVIQGRYAPDILHTYSAERQAVATELIEFDQHWSKMISTSATGSLRDAREETSKPAVDPEEFQRYFVKHGRYTAGTAIKYKPSMISAADTHQHLAQGFEIGTRFHSAPVMRLADGKPMQLGHTITADGRWRVLLFADAAHPNAEDSLLASLCQALKNSPDSPVRRYTPADADIDSVFDVRVVFQQPHHSIELATLPALLLPQKGRYALYDYEKCFCVDHKSGNDIFKMRAVDAANGCIVVVRPDQHIANVLPLISYKILARFFDGFMVAPDIL